MIGIHNLRPPAGATHRRKRVGRGYGTHGKTSGRGHKGQGQRGTLPPPWFEGGQTPLIRRIPKRGFNSKFPKVYQVVNVGDIQRLVEVSGEKKITPELLARWSLIEQADGPVKVLGDGDISVAVEVVAHKFSKKAREKIEKAGGKVVEVEYKF